MHSLLQKLTRDHENLAKLLEVLERQLDDFHQGREHDLDLMYELVDYIESYEDQVHHPTEDLVYARLKELTEEKRVAVETLEEQHRILAEMSNKFRRSLDAIMHEGVMLRQEVEAQGRALVKMLKRHMELEEGEVFPLTDARLAESDWTELAERAPKYNDPVFGDPDPARFRTVFAHLAEELDLSSH